MDHGTFWQRGNDGITCPANNADQSTTESERGISGKSTSNDAHEANASSRIKSSDLFQFLG